MTMPLFNLEPPTPAPAALLSARGLELVMAGRCAQLDATTDPDGRDIVWLSADWGSAFCDPAEEDDPEAVHQLLDAGRLILGCPVGARLAGELHHARLVIGPIGEVSSR